MASEYARKPRNIRSIYARPHETDSCDQNKSCGETEGRLIQRAVGEKPSETDHQDKPCGKTEGKPTRRKVRDKSSEKVGKLSSVKKKGVKRVSESSTIDVPDGCVKFKESREGEASSKADGDVDSASQGKGSARPQRARKRNRWFDDAVWTTGSPLVGEERKNSARKTVGKNETGTEGKGRIFDTQGKGRSKAEGKNKNHTTESGCEDWTEAEGKGQAEAGGKGQSKTEGKGQAKTVGKSLAKTEGKGQIKTEGEGQTKTGVKGSRRGRPRKPQSSAEKETRASSQTLRLLKRKLEDGSETTQLATEDDTNNGTTQLGTDVGSETVRRCFKEDSGQTGRRRCRKKNAGDELTEHYTQYNNDEVRHDTCSQPAPEQQRHRGSATSITDLKPYVCGTCQRRYATSSGLTEHERIHQQFGADNGGGGSSGGDDGGGVTSPNGADPQVFKCEFCRKVFGSRGAYKKHQKWHTKEKPFVCDTCGKGFLYAHYLESHRLQHSGQRPFACDLCPKTYRRNFDLTQHKRTHTGERPYACTVCGKAFMKMDYLKTHRQVHSGLKPFQCDQCPLRFRRNNLLKAHRATHTGVRLFRCEVCDKRLSTSNGLKKHRLTHLEKSHPDVLSACQICEVCGASIGRKSSLKVHMMTHTGERPYQCEVCFKGYITKNEFLIHRRSHTGERPFLCPVCSASYTRKANLDHHISTVHWGSRPHFCDVCSKAFADRRTLKEHRLIHTGVRPHKCGHCGKGFTQAGSLKAHVRTHTGERPFACVFCPRTFADASSKNRHVRVHTGEKPYRCAQCPAGFGRPESLKLHRETAHGDSFVPGRRNRRRTPPASPANRAVLVQASGEFSVGGPLAERDGEEGRFTTVVRPAGSCQDTGGSPDAASGPTIIMESKQHLDNLSTFDRTVIVEAIERVDHSSPSIPGRVESWEHLENNSKCSQAVAVKSTENVDSAAVSGGQTVVSGLSEHLENVSTSNPTVIIESTEHLDGTFMSDRTAAAESGEDSDSAVFSGPTILVSADHDGDSLPTIIVQSVEENNSGAPFASDSRVDNFGAFEVIGGVNGPLAVGRNWGSSAVGEVPQTIVYSSESLSGSDLVEYIIVEHPDLTDSQVTHGDGLLASDYVFFQAPDAIVQASSAVIQAPDAIVQAPETIVQASDAIVQAPETIVQTPDAILQTPDAIVQAPDAIVQTPDAIVQAPDAIVQTPDAMVQTPDAILHTPDAIVQAPDSIVQTPDSIVQTPDEMLQTPDAVVEVQVRRRTGAAPEVVQVTYQIPADQPPPLFNTQINHTDDLPTSSVSGMQVECTENERIRSDCGEKAEEYVETKSGLVIVEPETSCHFVESTAHVTNAASRAAAFDIIKDLTPAAAVEPPQSILRVKERNTMTVSMSDSRGESFDDGDQKPSVYPETNAAGTLAIACSQADSYPVQKGATVTVLDSNLHSPVQFYHAHQADDAACATVLKSQAEPDSEPSTSYSVEQAGRNGFKNASASEPIDPKPARGIESTEVNSTADDRASLKDAGASVAEEKPVLESVKQENSVQQEHSVEYSVQQEKEPFDQPLAPTGCKEEVKDDGGGGAVEVDGCLVPDAFLRPRRSFGKGKKDWMCHLCGKGFTQRASLRKHLTVQHQAGGGDTDRAWTCPDCRRVCVSRSELAAHARSHSGERPFPCGICGKAYKHKADLRQHTLAGHMGRKPYTCEVCRKTFTAKRGLTAHMLIHQGVKPHRCSVCGKAFTQPNGLTSHMRVHSGQRPFVCQFCGKGFTERSSFSRHVRIHTGERPYRCGRCPQAFARREQLKSHVDRWHPAAEDLRDLATLAEVAATEK